MGRSRIYAYVYLFFMLFGPKIGTYLDTSIIASILTIIVYAFNNDHKIPITGMQKRMIISLFFILLYSIFISIINLNMDVVYYGRMLRTLFSIYSLYLFCTYSGFENDDLVNIIVNILLLHAIVIILSATVFLNWQVILRGFTAYNKHVRQFRSTGLMAGFDMAGLLCNIGIVLLLSQKRFNILKYLVFVVAVVFTSRFSLVSLSIILVIYLLFVRNGIRGTWVKGIVLATLVFAGLFALSLLIITTSNVITNTFDLSRFNRIYNLALSFNDSYAQTDALATWDKYFNFSYGAGSVIFGRGVYGGGDPGYVRIINCVGVLGLIMIISWHLKYIKKVFAQKLIDDNEKNRRNYVLFIFVLVLIGLNFKNSYFYTGTFFELMIFELFIWNRRFYEVSEKDLE